jgi:hypothetical protein
MKGYQSHEAFWTDFLMYKNLVIRALALGFLVQFIALSWICQTTAETLKKVSIAGTTIRMPATVITKYYFGYDLFQKGIEVEPELRVYVKNYPCLPLNAYRTMADWLTNNTYKNAKDHIIFCFKLSFLAYLLSVAYIIIFLSTSNTIESEKFIRGTELLPLEELNKLLQVEAKKNPLSCLKINETIITFMLEVMHILILGTAGSGKSVLINQLMVEIFNRKKTYHTNDKMIVYDLKGEFVAKQYNKGQDLIFSPADARSVQWNFFNELENILDYDVVSQSLFACSDDKNSISVA